MTSLNNRSRLANLMFPFALVTSLLLWHGSVSAEVYKWTDEQGEVQYTQVPPPTGIQSTRLGPAAPPADNPATITGHLEERIKASEEANKQQLDASQKQQKQIEIRKIRQQNCVAAHNNVEQLNRGGQVRYRTSDGEVLHLSDEDRNKRIEEARKQIKENCES